MSGYAPDGTPRKKDRDPALKILAGCAIVAGALIALIFIVAGVGGWLLVRDTTPPGRPEEPFLLGGDTAYWSFDLRPDDPGLAVVLAHLQDTGERLRRESAPQSPLAHLRIPRRDAELDQIFPVRVEAADGPSGWAARFTMSKQVLRMRAALRVARWLMTRDARQAANDEVEGVTMTTLRPHGKAVASFAMVGPRFLVTERPGRLRDALSVHPVIEASRAPAYLSGPEIERRHEKVRRDGELGWGFAGRVELPGRRSADCVGQATASFALSPKGALDVVAVAEGQDSACELGSLDAAAARTIVAALLPRLDPESVVVKEGSLARGEDGAWRFEASIPDFPEQFQQALVRIAARDAAKRADDVSGFPEPTVPSPTRPRPSPGTTSGPRSGTRAAPPRGGSPTPPR